jgi:cytochrome c biogenesis protein CcmG/thiol:disulfide interchange protein DsbE
MTTLSDPSPSPIPVQKSKAVLGWVAVWLFVLAILGAVAYKLFVMGQNQVSSGAAPTFTLQTFDGQTVDLAALRGKVVVVNFWASWCDPCKQEARDLEQFHQAYKDRGVALVGVDYVDTETEARAYLTNFGVTYPNGPDLGTKISQAYRIQGVPETYIVDKTGRLVTNIIGPTTQANLALIVDPLIK